jgi:hypothetical protein
MENKTMESKLIPILREGIDVIKMIFFKELKKGIIDSYPNESPVIQGKLAGAVLNEIFGVVNHEPKFMEFAITNKEQISEILAEIPEKHPDMLIPLTDALRIQFLCDSQEGNDDQSTLQKAQELNILCERDMPMPQNFLYLVRRLGSSLNLLNDVKE